MTDASAHANPTPSRAQIPTGWETVPADLLSAQVHHARTAASWANTTVGHRHLGRLAEEEPTHPALLVGLWRHDTAPGPTDLYLVGLLGHLPDLATAHRLLHRPESAALTRAAARLRPDDALYLAEAQTLAHMESLLLACDAALTGSGLDPDNRAAGAHFLCARQRPDLFPATAAAHSDNGHRATWQLRRTASCDTLVRQLLGDLTQTGALPQGLPELSLLDLCLTAHAQHTDPPTRRTEDRS